MRPDSVFRGCLLGGGVVCLVWFLACLPPPIDPDPAAAEPPGASGGANAPAAPFSVDVDLSEFFPAPDDQGESDSSVAWALSYVLTCLHAQASGADPKNDNHRFSPAFIYNYFARGDCTTRVRFGDALNRVFLMGCSPWANMPWVDGDCATQASEAADDEARRYRASAEKIDVERLQIVQEWLDRHVPVLVSIRLHRAFDELHGEEATYCPTDDDARDSRGDRALVVVGYSIGRQALKVVNSRGTA